MEVSVESPKYLGPNTSLYNTISTDTVRLLEKAIALKRIGSYNEAQAIFNELQPVHTTPVVLIEHADLLLEMGRWGKVCRLLDQPLKDLEHISESAEYRLLYLMWAACCIRCRGNLKPAIKEVQRTKEWLWDVPIAEYTDIQVSCVRRYVLTYLFTRLSTSFDEPEYEMIPNPVDANPRQPWAGLKDLRVSLMERGMVKEAVALFRIELNRTPQLQRTQVGIDFLGDLSKFPRDVFDELTEAEIGLQLADNLLNQLGAVDAAGHLATQCEKLIGSWCTAQEVKNWKEKLPLYLNLEYMKLGLISDVHERLSAQEDLLVKLQAAQHAKIPMLFSRTAELALEISSQPGIENPKLYVDKFYSLQRALEGVDENVSEDLCDLVAHQNDVITVSMRNMVDRKKALEWIQSFLFKHPDFQDPQCLKLLYVNLAIILESLRDLEGAKAAYEKAEEYRKQAAVFRSWLHLRSIAFQDHKEAMNEGENDREEDEDLTNEAEGEGHWFNDWSNTYHDTTKTVQKLVSLFVKWAFDDFQAGRMSESDFRSLMEAPDSEFPNFDLDVLKKIKDFLLGTDPALIFAYYFVPNEEPHALGFEERYNRVVTWIAQSPRNIRLRRQFFFVVCSNARQTLLTELKLWDLSIQAFEMSIDSYQTLPQIVRYHTKGMVADWHMGAAWSYIMKHIGLGDIHQDFDLILKSEQHALAALQRFRDEQRISQVAMGLRLCAEICLKKIYHLTRPTKSTDGTSREPAPADESNISELREKGLNYLVESDKIFTDGELEASWSEGLQGLDDRQRLAEFDLNFHTVQRAISLLLTEKTHSEHTRVEVWKWIQKFKARSLSRLIGMKSASPPGLVNRILADAECKPLYERMIEIQQTIEQAPAGSRFHLRKELDAHFEEMRKHELLSQLLSLREGQPLTSADIATITAASGKPTVFVDWMFLPGWYTEPLFILATARVGRAPTLDVLPTSVLALATWTEENMTPDKLGIFNVRDQFVKNFSSLVEPLARHTDEGDMIVLCPSSRFLHRLPLHVLNVEPRYPLIQRNPVAYIHSLSLLHACVSASDHAYYAKERLDPVFFSGIGEAQASNHQEGRKSVKELAGEFGVEPLIDEGARKEMLLEKIGRTSMLHLHTHCNFTAGAALEHALEFPALAQTSPLPPAIVTADPSSLEAPINPSPSSSSSTTPNPANPTLTARELFNLTLRPGAHITMIACSGGRADISQADEVMGLVPAWLYCGAASTVSTLWPIGDGDGAEFARVFLEDFFPENGDGDDGSDGEDENDEDHEREEADSREQKKGLENFDTMKGALDQVVEIAGARNSADGKVGREKKVRYVDLAEAVRDATRSLDQNEDRPLRVWAGFVLHGWWKFPVFE
ncbi:hypothetical protein K402DRAFT_388885 [Aulographum hederae CBS 113979]|uniref:CHAT domain-containing protein n=1 Tax=Aulographum hederae CBS 113979 TaxID=1176131 RepID=A0A6G1HEJ1_9PEZI|nr:hypothetical protein K402DRAFT_388885 [Aulographum hederae CBS 113979]